MDLEGRILGSDAKYWVCERLNSQRERRGIRDETGQPYFPGRDALRMPTAAMRVCATPKCGILVRSGHCAAHTPKPPDPWRRQGPQPKRIRGRTLQTLRRRLFEREPLCRSCGLVGRVTPATIRDHIINLSEGGSDTEDNVQPLCQRCSDLKTTEESRRGRNRRPEIGKNDKDLTK